MMLEQQLRSKLGDCKFAETSLCKSKSSYENISETEFYIYDPHETNQPVRVVCVEEDHQLKVNNHSETQVCIVKTDKCLFPNGVSKCDCILFNSNNLYFVEINSSVIFKDVEMLKTKLG